MKKEWHDFGRGIAREDDCALYIVPAVAVVLEGHGGVAMDGGWVIVERHVPRLTPKHVAGPFPTLDGAKAAYIVLAPRYPGP